MFLSSFLMTIVISVLASIALVTFFFIILIFGDDNIDNKSLKILSSFVIMSVFCFLTFFSGSHYGINHIGDEEQIMSSKINMNIAFPHMASDNIINDIVIINDEGKQHHLDSHIDHIAGFNILKKNTDDALIKIDYVEDVENQFESHKDLALISNKNISELKNSLWISEGIWENLLPDTQSKLTHVDDTEQNIHRLQKLLN